jgi:hypothetical protein
MTSPQITTDDPATAGDRDHAPAPLCIPGHTAMTGRATHILQGKAATDVVAALATVGMMPIGTEQ